MAWDISLGFSRQRHVWFLFVRIAGTRIFYVVKARLAIGCSCRNPPRIAMYATTPHSNSPRFAVRVCFRCIGEKCHASTCAACCKRFASHEYCSAATECRQRLRAENTARNGISIIAIFFNYLMCSGCVLVAQILESARRTKSHQQLHQPRSGRQLLHDLICRILWYAVDAILPSTCCIFAKFGVFFFFLVSTAVRTTPAHATSTT